jgi:tetratricopeptide (TPR) repeat protein
MAQATLCLVLLPGWADVAGWLDLHPPAWVERILWNAGDRTEEGLAQLEEGETLAAVEQLERAHRIAPDDPRVAYNAGTARLLAGRSDAVELLAATAETAPPDLAPDAFYNLGNAHLEDDHPGRAVAAYEEALRRRPDFEDAKFNLEVALARAADDRMRFGPPEDSPEGNRDGDQDESDRSSDDGQRPPDEERDDEDSSNTDPSGDRQDEQTDSRGGGAGQRPEPLLPDFEEQADMTAEQAAALLQAVENLERRERQARAAEAAARTERAEKDW